MIKICRFANSAGAIQWGVVNPDDSIGSLAGVGVASLGDVVEAKDPLGILQRAIEKGLPSIASDQIRLLAPVDRQEVWAAGVTYLRSKAARMEESEFSASAYDRVYDAERPELFLKSLPEKVVATGGQVGIRSDSNWNVPEPELALVMNSSGTVVGCTIGNDMSSRDIEGENTLYLPQAKVYRLSCALGPCIVIGATESEAREWTIHLTIERSGETAFAGETSVSQLKRSFDELAEFLFRCQDHPHGAVLLTGTGLVPPDEFTLAVDDVVTIRISGIGQLVNTVVSV